jgi:arylsulfatase A-like enzyme
MKNVFPMKAWYGRIIIGGLLISMILTSCSSKRPQEKSGTMRKPNIIYILADDLGYGDLSCYGQLKFQTPNIDRLAEEGIRFIQHYAGATVCAPSRSALMTGMHTGHTPIRGNKEWQPEGQWPIPDETFTLAELLKSDGYVTGAFGKWGLGFIDTEGDPNRQGFDQFFGYNCQRLAHNYYPAYLWDNHQKIEFEANKGLNKGTYGPEVIHQKALQFLEQNKDTNFFLYYPATLPHAELAVPEEYMKRFRGKLLPEKEFVGVDDGANFRKGPYGSQREAHAAFAGMVTMLDDMVGDVLKKVHELGLDENTLIIFTSDNGPHVEGGGDPDYFNSNGGLRGYKRDLYEGGIRVPMIARWTGRIPEGTLTDHVSAFWDVMPTMADLLGIDLVEKTDGISFLPTLFGKKESQQQHELLYWEFHELKGRVAIRRGDWKLIQYDVKGSPQGPYTLYNLHDDVQEQNDVAAQNPEKVAELKTLMDVQRTPSEIFDF